MPQNYFESFRVLSCSASEFRRKSPVAQLQCARIPSKVPVSSVTVPPNSIESLRALSCNASEFLWKSPGSQLQLFQVPSKVSGSSVAEAPNSIESSQILRKSPGTQLQCLRICWKVSLLVLDKNLQNIVGLGVETHSVIPGSPSVVVTFYITTRTLQRYLC